ncbi:hypothetical protein OAN80_03695, partial [Alphaproteobacteria bacterium]|nr:hypothetical protein [Alphaproteobacteria bacterium]
MIVFGWVSFAIGSAILAWAGFIGVDAGSSGPRVVNFGGLTLGAAIMVSGAVIGSVGILGETIVSSINKIALARSQNSKSDIIEKSPGFVFPPRVVDISRDRQNRKLTLCGVDPTIWGDAGDPTFMGVFAIMAQRWSGRSINGNVHMTQIFRLNNPLPLDQPITMAGEVSRVEPHPRGSQVFTDFAFALNDGSVPLRASRSSLNPGPGDSSGRRVAMPTDPLAGMTQISEVQLIPENVANFSDE